MRTIRLLTALLVGPILITLMSGFTVGAQAASPAGPAMGWRCLNDGNGNTLYALNKLARTTNKVGCEIDVRITKGGRWVLWHDEHLGEATAKSVPGKVAPYKVQMRDLTYAQAKQVRYRTGKKLPLATAERFFKRAAALRMPLLVQVKVEPTSRPSARRIEQLVALAERTGVNARWYVYDPWEGWDSVRQLKEAGARFVGAKTARCAYVAGLGANFVPLHRPAITKAVVEECAAVGVEVRAQMAPPTSWKKLYRLLGGPHWVTNKPARASAWLARR